MHENNIYTHTQKHKHIHGNYHQGKIRLQQNAEIPWAIQNPLKQNILGVTFLRK